MNIAFVVPSLANKGPIIVVRDIVLGLLSRGHKCHVFYFDGQKELEMSCSVSKIDFSKTYDFSEFDIVHSHGLRPDIYVRRKVSSNGIKKVTTLHSYLKDDLKYEYNLVISFFFSKLWMFTVKSFDKVVVLTEHAKAYYEKFISEKKLAVAYNTSTAILDEKLSVDLDRQLKEIKNNYKIIGVNALLTPRKGVDQLVKSLVNLPQCFLVVVGDGKSKAELEELAKNLGVDDRCLFLGYQVNAFRFLPYYDVYAMTSRSEGFGLVVLEAAQYGIPVVCSDLPLFRELYTENDVAFFSLEDISSLERAIIDVLNNSEYGKSLHQTFHSKYSLEHFTDRYIQIYHEEINK